jgi:CSLREA domain-containing protein
MFASRSVGAALVLGLCSPLAMAENVISVSRTADRFDPACVSDCSLREAIYRANHTPGATRIVLRSGTYTLTLSDPIWNQETDPDPDENECSRGDLDVRGELTIIGAGQAETIIRSTGEPLTGDRLIEVVEGASLNLRRLTLRDGLSDTQGGAIRNHGRLLVQQVSFIGNRSSAGIEGQGGAIANYGTMTVSQALFDSNLSIGKQGFFGLGGAIFNLGAVKVRDTTFRDNIAADYDDTELAQGGALYNQGHADVARSTFVGNTAGLSIDNGGGAAIANRRGGVLLLANSTLSGNSGTDTNGVLANGISGYPEDARAQAKLVNVTIAGNQGLALSNVGQLVLRNSLVAGNRLDGMPANCANSGSYQARGLLLGTDQGNCASDLPTDDALTWSKVLHPLADNGGTTWTHALRRASPAVDVGVGSCTSIDQRAVTRPYDGDGDGSAVCDLGAYERTRP